MATVEKRPLTDEEKEDTARLAAAWEEYKSKSPGATQTWLGAASGIGSQGLVGQYLRGVIPLNLKTLLAIARLIGADARVISPSLTKDMDSAIPDAMADAVKTLPDDLRAIFSAYNSGGSEKQEALLRLAQLPKEEMQTLLLVIQSIGAKYNK